MHRDYTQSRFLSSAQIARESPETEHEGVTREFTDTHTQGAHGGQSRGSCDTGGRETREMLLGACDEFNQFVYASKTKNIIYS